MAAFFVFVAMSVSGALTAPSSLHHEAVDEQSYPWSAIGKLSNAAGNQCSGVVISRNEVLTAGHCLFNRRSARFADTVSLLFVAGYRAGLPSIKRQIASYRVGQGFDPLRYRATTDVDWAVLTLAEDLPADIAPLPLSREIEPSGTKAILAGYSQDRAFAMTADRDCELRQSIASGKLLLHTCRGTRGYSGGPIMVSSSSGDVKVAGVHIATMRAGDLELAVPATSICRGGNDCGSSH